MRRIHFRSDTLPACGFVFGPGGFPAAQPSLALHDSEAWCFECWDRVGRPKLATPRVIRADGWTAEIALEKEPGLWVAPKRCASVYEGQRCALPAGHTGNCGDGTGFCWSVAVAPSAGPAVDVHLRLGGKILCGLPNDVPTTLTLAKATCVRCLQVEVNANAAQALRLMEERDSLEQRLAQSQADYAAALRERDAWMIAERWACIALACFCDDHRLVGSHHADCPAKRVEVRTRLAAGLPPDPVAPLLREVQELKRLVQLAGVEAERKVAEAVATEREECARAAEAWDSLVGRQIAGLIRARTEPKEDVPR
jgi:hypothetical protein